MKTPLLMIITFFIISMNSVQAANDTVSELMHSYVAQGANIGRAETGRQLWQKTFTGKGEFGQRSCTSCHTQDLTANGKHIKTNKVITAMAPSSNPERLTDRKKIEKWFKRNCKWTLGRECTVQEKADLLAYINNQS